MSYSGSVARRAFCSLPTHTVVILQRMRALRCLGLPLPSVPFVVFLLNRIQREMPLSMSHPHPVPGRTSFLQAQLHSAIQGHWAA